MKELFDGVIRGGGEVVKRGLMHPWIFTIIFSNLLASLVCVRLPTTFDFTIGHWETMIIILFAPMVHAVKLWPMDVAWPSGSY
jgi:hypothetical protein